MKNPRLFLPVIFAIIGILACKSYLVGDLLTQSGDVLFVDDFSDPGSGWARASSPSGVMDYDNNGYRIWVNTPNYDLWSTPGLDFSDVRIEVDAAKVGGPDENRFGLICRYRDGQNFYFLIVSSDGYYAIGKVQDGQRTLLGQEMMAYSAAIKTGMDINHLRADCFGAGLMLYVNGMLVAAVQGDDFTSGDVGLLVGTFDQPGADVLFDNFVVLKP